MKEPVTKERQPSIFRDHLLTRGDLEDFKKDLFLEIKSLLADSNSQSVKQWLRSSEVRKMLGISTGTLQNLRVNKTIAYSKIGGIVFYKREDLIKVLESHNSTKTAQQ